MGLLDDIRAHAAEVARTARFVRLDPGALDAIAPAPPPVLDPALHPVELPEEERVRFVFVWDAINFGSGWFPTLRKRPGCSGSLTILSALTDHARAHGVWSTAELEALDATAVAAVLGQDPDHELMGLHARALNDLGPWLEAHPELPPTAEALATELAGGLPFFADRGFYKRAQILPHDLAQAGLATFPDVDRLTIFADNLVPHVLRVDGVLRYDDGLAARIDAGRLIAPGSREEVEIRACALHAVELLSRRTGTPPRLLDEGLWHRGQSPGYKARPRHRTRTVFY